MLSFSSKQKIYGIGSVKVGGLLGQLPTVVISSLFYKGMPEVSNHNKGIFDRKSVKNWISIAESLSSRCGTPHLLEVMSMHPKAIRNFIEFTSEVTENPFIIGGSNLETRLEALKIVEEKGLSKNVIFNGVTPDTSKEELESVEDAKIKFVIAIPFSDLDFSPVSRIEILENNEKSNSMGLISKLQDVGVEKILVDAIVIDTSSVLQAAEAIKLVKDQLGYPCGCSPANASYAWKKTHTSSCFKSGFNAINAALHSILQFWGADFLIYGPIKQAENIIPTCAFNDAMIAHYCMKRFGIKPLVKEHPLYLMF